MKPGTSLLRRTPLERRAGIRPKRKASTRPRMKPLRALDPAHMEEVRGLPCVVCVRLGLVQTTHTEAHHIKRDPETGRVLGRGQKAPDTHTIPLCVRHHREGAPGEAFHATGRRRWEAAHGNELVLLHRTRICLGIESVAPEAA